ncbi:hypothetical protein [Marinobacter santoriniensis]|nr:hypothetical protein [Marinobacter santoriniensis]
MKSIVLLLLTSVAMTGCASYYTHFAMFPAENSQGATRQVRVSWDTAEYPGWWFSDNQTTSVKVETQCSARVWRLYDDGHDQAVDCGRGIRACGDKALDWKVVALPGLDASACMVINPGDEQATIAGMGDRFDLLVACEPTRPVVQKADEKVNMDYLRASSVPYTVYARKAPRGSLRARLPEFDDSVCDD